MTKTWNDTVREEKERLIAELLANNTYRPDSGVYKGVAERLMKMPIDAIRNLKLIIGLKEVG